ncbi:diguanylate cyclase domain-containing protein [Methanobacterium sp.]|uniref:diguanylate cyclase domain-containing protein n=1 Tax=Methanobacterium sp. TaxID=2164 RepID=UPI003C74A055
MKKILVVEDEAIVAQDIKSKLEDLNYIVPKIVYNGKDAIKSVSKLDIDLILMDIMLQGDMDGIEAAEEIKKYFDIPIIYISAHSDKNTLKRAKLTEPFGYLIKPFDENELQISIEIALYKHKMDSKIRYIGTHDALTGLYNRAYFQQEISRLVSENSSTVGVIVCDLDGLKLINDTLGHDKGDEALEIASNIMKENVRVDDIVARIGGDEFAILIPNTSKKDVRKIYERIKESFKDNNLLSVTKIPWSISIGYATTEANINVYEAQKLAEDHMYREKLGKSQSSRSNVSKILKKVLEERDNETADHLDRLDTITLKFAKKLSLSDQRINDLRLLAKFHDIGKVGIPDEILFKPDKLEKEEMRIMQRHSEIGYRIASSTSQLRPIAEFILKHHEWWNGKGYPFGLKGKKIPLESRIIAIIDAYDAMVHERSYKIAFTSKKALSEIKKCSGIQFDPCLVEEFIAMMEKSEKF